MSQVAPNAIGTVWPRRLVADYHGAGRQVQQAALLEGDPAPLAAALQQASDPRSHAPCHPPPMPGGPCMLCAGTGCGPPGGVDRTIGREIINIHIIVLVCVSTTSRLFCVTQVVGNHAYRQSAQRLSTRLQARRGTPRSRVRRQCGSV